MSTRVATSYLASALAVVVLASSAATRVGAEAPIEELDTPFVVTPTNVVTAMLDLADVKEGERLLDLGSGDGRIVLAAAQRGATAVGVEIDSNLVDRSRASARRMNLADRARFVTQDLFEIDYAGYEVVTLYLLPDVNRRLAPKLAALKAGTRIVSHDYGLGDWPPDRTIVVDAPDKPVNIDKRSTLHFWRVPARVEGRWQGEAGGEPIVLELRQRHQHVSGALLFAAHEYRFADARVDGERLGFALKRRDGAELAVDLRASGNRIIGELRIAGERSRPVELRR